MHHLFTNATGLGPRLSPQWATGQCDIIASHLRALPTVLGFTKKATGRWNSLGKSGRNMNKPWFFNTQEMEFPWNLPKKKKMEFHWVRWVSGHLFDFDIKEVQALLTDRKPPTAWLKWGSLLQKRWGWSENGLSKNPMVDHHVPHWICYGSLGI